MRSRRTDREPQDALTWPATDADTRDVDELFREAVAIRSLLQSLEADDHHLRSTLLVARDDIRANAARAWASRGWRPITDNR